MTTLSVPPGCTGVELPTGQKYDADRRGHVDVPDRAEKFALSTNLAKTGVIAKRVTTLRVGPSRFCPACGFEGFRFQTTCPRCRTAMSEVGEEQ